jgi:phage terminase small subunit
MHKAQPSRERQLSTDLIEVRGTPLDDHADEDLCRVYVAEGYHCGNAAARLGRTYFATYRSLQRPVIKRRVRELGDGLLRDGDITAQRVMLELSRIALSDHRALYGEDGALLHPRDMDDDAAAAVSSITHEQRTEPGPRELDPATGKLRPSRRTIEVVKVRKYDKVAALSLLARHFKLVGEDNDGINALANTLADRLKAARHRVVHAASEAEGPPPSPDHSPADGRMGTSEILEYTDVEHRDVTSNAEPPLW